MITFTVTGQPEPQGSTKGFIVRNKNAFPPPTPEETKRVRARFRVAITSDNPSLVQWRQLVALTAQPHVTEVIAGGVHVGLDFFLPKPKSAPRRLRRHLTKPDLDKLERAILDALTGVFYRDDSEVVHVEKWKRYAEDGAPPSVVITILPIDDYDPLPPLETKARVAVEEPALF